LGDLPGGTFSGGAFGVSADGSVIVGNSNSANGTEAFRWTQGTGIVGLGSLIGGSSFASYGNATSADGSVVVGQSNSASDYQAFRWTQAAGMVGLGDLPSGINFSAAYGVSADGSVIVGVGHSASGQEAFRWTLATGMVGLGDLPGAKTGAAFDSRGYGVSADGSTVVGASQSSNGLEAFRWTQATGMVGLGDLPGSVFTSIAEATSGDGSIVVGEGNEGTTSSRAFIWDAAHGMRDLEDVLINDYGLGASLVGWHLWAATGISADGNVIVGSGTYPDDSQGINAGWVVDLVPEPPAVATFGFGSIALLSVPLLRPKQRQRMSMFIRRNAALEASFMWSSPVDSTSTPG